LEKYLLRFFARFKISPIDLLLSNTVF
jgi:hypothetical protein